MMSQLPHDFATVSPPPGAASDIGPWRLPSLTGPDPSPSQLWAVDGRFTSVESDDAAALPGDWVIPGLVDAHTHVGIRDAEPVEIAEMRAAMGGHAAGGILAVRDLGAHESMTLDLGTDPGWPVLIASGRVLATADTFLGWHDAVSADELVDAALAEVARGAAWIKVICDWETSDLAYEPSLLAEVVAAVHDAGARVAAHTQWERAGEVVATGVDSIEHGCLLDEAALHEMARRGTAWVPTIGAFAAPLPTGASDEWREAQRRWLDNYRRMLPLAAEVGVTVLAGADNEQSVVNEVRILAEYGLSPDHALRAATTEARTFLGLPGLEDGAIADAVTYGADPRSNLEVLYQPLAILRAGRRIR